MMSREWIYGGAGVVVAFVVAWFIFGRETENDMAKEATKQPASASVAEESAENDEVARLRKQVENLIDELDKRQQPATAPAISSAEPKESGPVPLSLREERKLTFVENLAESSESLSVYDPDLNIWVRTGLSGKAYEEGQADVKRYQQQRATEKLRFRGAKEARIMKLSLEREKLQAQLAAIEGKIPNFGNYDLTKTADYARLREAAAAIRPQLEALNEAIKAITTPVAPAVHKEHPLPE